MLQESNAGMKKYNPSNNYVIGLLYITQWALPTLNPVSVS